MKKISILIPVFNHIAYTKKCLENLYSMLKQHDVLEYYEIVVIDDGSSDGTSEFIRQQYTDIHLLYGDGGLWWSGGINKGAKYAIEELNSTHLLLWNNDIEVNDDYFKVLIDLTEEYDEKTIIGSKVFADIACTKVWTMGGMFNPITGKTYMKAFMAPDSDEYNTPCEADWLTGMGTLVPSAVVREIGYWDEVNFPQYHGDTEFTYRAKMKGFRNVVNPRLVIRNDIENTGLNHEGKLSSLMKMTRDKRSLYNYKVNITFYKLYAKCPIAYLNLWFRYFRLYGGFFKWKLLSSFGIRKN